MDLDSIIEEFSTTPESGEESNDSLLEAAEADGLDENYIDEIFGETKEEPPVVETKEETTNPEATEKTETQTEEPQPFESALKTMLYNEEGDLNTEALQTGFLDPKKSFLDHVRYDPPKPEVEKSTVATPEEKYNNSVGELIDGLPGLIAQDKTAGYTPEETLQRLQNTFNGLGNERDTAKRVFDELAANGNEYKDELSQIRAERREAKILKNSAELSSVYEGVVPGVSGADTLSHFMLDKEFGGRVTNHFFMRDNPNFSNLSEEEKATASESWYKDFQSNKADMAIAAHVGKLEYLVAQMPNLAKYAQKIGAAKKGAVDSVSNTTPSDIQNKQSNANQMDGALGEFLGLDSVN